MRSPSLGDSRQKALGNCTFRAATCCVVWFSLVRLRWKRIRRMQRIAIRNQPNSTRVGKLVRIEQTVWAMSKV
jgi:ribosomal protein S17